MHKRPNVSFLFIRGGGGGLQDIKWSARRRVYLSLPEPSLPLTLDFPSNSPVLLLSFAFSPFVAGCPLFPHTFNGYLPNHLFHCRKCQRTTLRESEECSILSFECVELANVCVCVCVRGQERGRQTGRVFSVSSMPALQLSVSLGNNSEVGGGVWWQPLRKDVHVDLSESEPCWCNFTEISLRNPLTPPITDTQLLTLFVRASTPHLSSHYILPLIFSPGSHL